MYVVTACLHTCTCTGACSYSPPALAPVQALKKTKTKTKMSLKDSASYLANSAYIRNLAALVICYGMSINIVEVSWKAKLKEAFPNPNDYAEFMGSFSSATGGVTLGMMLLGQRIFKVRTHLPLLPPYIPATSTSVHTCHSYQLTDLAYSRTASLTGCIGRGVHMSLLPTRQLTSSLTDSLTHSLSGPRFGAGASLHW